ncbi:MAG: NUDIX hydrolase [Bacteroidetes bacterium]|nr:NUDIX hydrolase [Bacteroidota bacterium]
MANTKQQPTEFALRVYAFLENENGMVLLSNEQYKGQHFSKLPGGGVELGECTLEAVVRELNEELKLVIEPASLKHVYTCDFVVQNAFNPKQQVIGVYFKVKITEKENTLLTSQLNETITDNNSQLISREWVEKHSIKNRLTFEMDCKAASVFIGDK